MTIASSAPNILITPELWLRYDIGDLRIVPSLVGASHRFKVNGASVEVRLPSLPSKKERKEFRRPYGDSRMFTTPQISCSHLKGGRPAAYDLHSVDVFVRLRRKVSIPADALGRLDSSRYPKRRQEMFARMMEPAVPIADDTLDVWLRTLRWKTVYGAIGQKQIVGRDSGWSAYLYDSATRKPFYWFGHFTSVGGSRPVSKRAWNKTSHALLQGTPPPVWFDLLFDGEHRVNSGDLHGGVVCLAIACESVVRVLLTKHLRTPVNEAIADYVSRMQIGRIFDQLGDLGFWSKRSQKATNLPTLKRLFYLRNAVMHRGNTGLKKTECQQIAAAARAFVAHASPYAEKLSAA